MPSVKSSSAKLHVSRPSRVTTPARRDSSVAPSDQDALDALDFAERGRPDTEIGYSEDAPRLTPEQLAEFKPASFRFTKRK